MTIAEVTDVLVPKGSFSFEFAVDGLRCGVGSARSKKEAKTSAEEARQAETEIHRIF